ncbi:adenine nucleotide alpha hydrolases superfamily protein [Staphylococcus aureus]|nr:adenine nucleotide alpha hydrolases superfamily protein [Staphylococcus aureus]
MINAEPIISKMKNQKINYDKVLKKLIGQWEREAIRPKILLHSCWYIYIRVFNTICRHCNLFREFKYSSEK